MKVFETSRLLTVEEAADVLRCSQQSVRQYCRNGSLTAIRPGGKWLIYARQLTDNDAVIVGRKTSK